MASRAWGSSPFERKDPEPSSPMVASRFRTARSSSSTGANRSRKSSVSKNRMSVVAASSQTGQSIRSAGAGGAVPVTSCSGATV